MNYYGDYLGFENYVSEKDYPAICRGIAEKMKQFGGNISYVHNKAWVINGDHRDIEKYMYNYAFELIDEGDVSYWASEEENENRSDYVNEFIEDMQHSFGAIGETCRSRILSSSENIIYSSPASSLSFRRVSASGLLFPAVTSSFRI